MRWAVWVEAAVAVVPVLCRVLLGVTDWDRESDVCNGESFPAAPLCRDEVLIVDARSVSLSLSRFEAAAALRPSLLFCLIRSSSCATTSSCKCKENAEHKTSRKI